MMDTTIAAIRGRRVWDSRGRPTVEAEILLKSGLRHQLVKALDAMPEREQLLLSLYYEQELNLREIGEVMGVTESRVCQLHTQAIARLRSQFTGELPAAKQRRKEKTVG